MTQENQPETETETPDPFADATNESHPCDLAEPNLTFPTNKFGDLRIRQCNCGSIFVQKLDNDMFPVDFEISINQLNLSEPELVDRMCREFDWEKITQSSEPAGIQTLSLFGLLNMLLGPKGPLQ